MPGLFVVLRSLALTPPIPTVEPDTLFAGDTAKWTKTISDYPATDGWTLTYSFRGPTALADQVATTSGSGYAVTIPASSTSPLSRGTYQWTARVSKAGEVYVVARGVLVVELVVGAPVTSHEEKVLALIEAAIEGRVPADMQQYAIDGRQITKIPIFELVKLRGIYEAKVSRRANPGRLGTPVYTTFTPADGTVGNPSPVVLPPWYRVGG